MTVLRIIFWLGWVFGMFIASIEGNQIFTRLSFQWGLAPSLLLALVSGWAYFWVAQALAPHHRRREAMLATAVIIAPLCLVFGGMGLVQASQATLSQTAFDMHGVGPVHLVAYLPQALGIALAFRHEWRVQRSGARLDLKP